MRQHIFFTLIFFLCFKNTYSQKDYVASYIIKNNLDTVFGFGIISLDQKYCLFKKNNDSVVVKYNPGDIDALRIINGKYYKSMQIPFDTDSLRWCFLEYLVDGEIDLFALDYDRKFFMKKENEPLIELNDRKSYNKKIDGVEYNIHDTKYLRYMKYYMQDAPQLLPKIEKLDRLYQSNLVNIAVDYHNAVCKNYECINYTKKITKQFIKIESAFGINYHNRYYSPFISTLFHLVPFTRQEYFFIVIGLLYSDKPHYMKENDEIDKYDYNITFSGSCEFVIGKKRIKPILSFGYIYEYGPTIQTGLIYSISNRFELIMKGAYDGYPFYSKLYFNNSFGHSLSLGFIYKL
jgi:hypothetical protein